MFNREGLNVEDYIVESKVPLKTVDDLMVDSLADGSDRKDMIGPLILLIDAERNDCDIVMGISPTSKALPYYIIFERHSCYDGMENKAVEHLKLLGYEFLTARARATTPRKVDNHIAVLKDTSVSRVG